MFFTFQHPHHALNPKPNKYLECEIFANDRILKGTDKNSEFLWNQGYHRKIVYRILDKIAALRFWHCL